MSTRLSSAAPAASHIPQLAITLRPGPPGALLSSSAACAASVRHAIELLSRASADWRNGDQGTEGALHWPVSVNLARRALRQALEALEAPAWRIDSHDARCRHCGGTGFDGDDPCEFCSGSGREADLEDALRGSIWWNSISRTERRYWLEAADSAVPADAWAAYKAGAPV